MEPGVMGKTKGASRGRVLRSAWSRVEGNEIKINEGVRLYRILKLRQTS